MKKSVLAIAFASLGAIALTSCGGTTATSSSAAATSSAATSSAATSSAAASSAAVSNDGVTHKLTIAGGELQASQDYLTEVANAFKTAHPETNFEFTVNAISEADAKTQLTQDPTTAPDVCIIADDQLYDLAKGKYVADINDIDATLANDVETRNVAISVSASKYGDDLYAFPVSNSNGFFLYYDSSILSLSDCDTFDGLLAAIKAASVKDSKNYKFAFPSTSGWYLAGWSQATGLTATLDKETSKTITNWNSTTATPTGADTFGALIKLSQGEYKNYWVGESDATAINDTAAGGTYQVIATINGTWSSSTIKTNWGTGAAATDLPSFTVGSTSYHMNSVGGCKLAVVNSVSSEAAWGAEFANFLTSKENQVLRYNELAEAPTNIVASSSVDLTTNYAVAALSLQSAYAFSLNVSNNFWTPTASLDAALNSGADGTTSLITSGAGTSSIVVDNTALQTTLDTCVTSMIA
jgi:arabinogalactan oligomer/maltooligosaccharide transport system substrate-binding protein